MTFDSATLWAFLTVFVRASAMMLSSPIFGAQTTPVNIRVLTTLSVAGALTMALKPSLGPLPTDLGSMTFVLGNELLAGLLIGVTISLVFHAIQMAGSFLDFQIGLGSSQILNPVTGVPVTIVGQLKFLLALVIFLTINGHHQMIEAFVASYKAMPQLGYQAIDEVQTQIVPLFGQLALLSLQIAAPVAAVSLIVDAGLGFVNKAVPQMQVLIIGMPAKLALGFIALSITLPAVATAVDFGVGEALDTLWKMGR